MPFCSSRGRDRAKKAMGDVQQRMEARIAGTGGSGGSWGGNRMWLPEGREELCLKPG